MGSVLQSFDAFQTSLTLPSPLQPFYPNWCGADKVSLFVKRDDAIHPIISGNKWRKLRYVYGDNLPSAMVSFGGGYSNHLHALGYLCHQLGVTLNVIIRGNYHNTPTPMITDLTKWGVHIQYVDRATYKKRNCRNYLATLQAKHPHALIIPEGGSQTLALEGVKDMVDEIDIDFDTVIAPVASGATLAGIINAINSNPMNRRSQRSNSGHLHSVIGIGVLKGEGYLESLVEQFIPASNAKHCKVQSGTALPLSDWCIKHDYHFGGYAKAPPELTAFCNDFNSTMPFDIEPVYSGKAFWAVKDMLAKGSFREQSRIVIVHTGGLQGAR